MPYRLSGRATSASEAVRLVCMCQDPSRHLFLQHLTSVLCTWQGLRKATHPGECGHGSPIISERDCVACAGYLASCRLQCHDLARSSSWHSINCPDCSACPGFDLKGSGAWVGGSR